jgi:insulin receptor
VDDVNDFVSTEDVTYPMTKLEPFTQYAFYVKAYMLSTEKTGAQSVIDYFRTLPGQPQAVSKLKAIEKSSSSVVSDSKDKNQSSDHFIIIFNRN